MALGPWAIKEQPKVIGNNPHLHFNGDKKTTYVLQSFFFSKENITKPFEKENSAKENKKLT